MTPRQPLPNSGSAPDAANEVVCPLKHQDGSSCRKRCIGVSPPSLPSSPSSHPLPYSMSTTSSTMQHLQITASSPCAGETISLHAGAYPQSSSRLLHRQATCHRGELRDDGQYSSLPETSAASPTVSPSSHSSQSLLLCGIESVSSRALH